MASVAATASAAVQRTERWLVMMGLRVSGTSRTYARGRASVDARPRRSCGGLRSAADPVRDLHEEGVVGLPGEEVGVVLGPRLVVELVREHLLAVLPDHEERGAGVVFPAHDGVGAELGGLEGVVLSRRRHIGDEAVVVLPGRR